MWRGDNMINREERLKLNTLFSEKAAISDKVEHNKKRYRASRKNVDDRALRESCYGKKSTYKTM